MKKKYVVLMLVMAFGSAQAEKIKVGDYPFKADSMPSIELHDSGLEVVPYIHQVVVSYSDADMEDSIKKLSLEDFQTAIITKNLNFKKNGKVKTQQKDIYINGVLCKTIKTNKGFFGSHTNESFCHFNYEKVVVEAKDELGAKTLKSRHQYFLNL